MIANAVKKLGRYKVRAIASLIIIYVATLMNWYWLWGALLLFWAINDLITEQTWLSESVTKRDSPLIYYTIVITWLVFGFYLLISPFAYLLR